MKTYLFLFCVCFDPEVQESSRG